MSLSRCFSDKVWSGKSVYCATEKDIFDALGLMYVPPEQRNVYNHFEPTEEEIRILRNNHFINNENQTDAANADATYQSSHATSPPIARALVSPTHSLSSSPSAASASASSSPFMLSPIGFPLKVEVKAELDEMNEVARAAAGLKRLAQEEAEIIKNQIAALQYQYGIGNKTV